MKKTILLFVILIFSISIAYASLGATLRVPGIETSLTLNVSNKNPLVGGLVVFSANYFDVNGSEITDADVNIEINGNIFKMNYNPARNAYVFQRNFPFVGTYFFTVTAEKQGYEPASIADSISVSEKSIDKTPGGGAPPSWINVNIGNIVGRHQSVSENKDINIELDVNKSNFNRIIITSAKTINRGTIDIDFLGCVDIEKFEGKIYFDCFRVNLYDISNEQISKSQIYFRVSKDWIENNDINESSVSVLKINEKIEELNATKINEDSNYNYYYIEFYEFSDFAIYGSKDDIEETPIKPPVEEHEDEIIHKDFEEIFQINIIPIIVVIFLFSSLVIFILKRKKKKSRNRINKKY